MSAPCPLDVEVWSEREEDLAALFAELHEEEARAEADQKEKQAGGS